MALVLALAWAPGAGFTRPASAGHLAIGGEGEGEGEKDKPKPDGCSEANPGAQCCHARPCCGANRSGYTAAAGSKPVSVVNGREFLERADLVVNGIYPIEMTRRYDSQSEYDSPLGYGWAWGFDLRLFEYPDAAGTVRIRNSCGYHYEFVWTGGDYVASDGRQETLTDDLNGKYTLTLPRGRKARFNADGTLGALEDPVGNRLEMTYDPTGKVDLIGTSPYAVDPDAQMVVARPYLLTQITEVTIAGATGRAVTLAYDPNTKRLASITASDGRVVTYDHYHAPGETKGNLRKVYGLGGIIETYTYTDPNDAHNLSSAQLGQDMTAWENEYDDQDRVVQQTYGDRVITLDYSTPLETTVTRTIADEAGQPLPSAVAIYEYNTSGYLTKRIDALKNEFRYFRDPQDYLDYLEVWHNQGTLQTPDLVLQKTVDYSFGLDGNLGERSVTLVRTGETVTETWEYDQHWLSVYQVVSDVPGKLFRTEYTFYRSGPNPTDPPTNIKEIKRRKDGGGFETTLFTYDGNGQLETITPPEVTPADQLKVVRGYYGLGETWPGLLKEIYLEVGGARDSHLEHSFAYDPHGNVDLVTDARGNTTDYDWDERGRVVGVKNGADESALFTYRGPSLADPDTAPPGEFLTTIEMGRTVAEGEGHVQRLRWDDLGRLRLVERNDDLDTFSTFATYEYDSDGNQRIAADAANRDWEFDYDPLGRLVSVTDDASNTTVFAYDATGNRTSLTDALSREKEFEYDELDRLILERSLGSPSAPLSPPLETSFTHDAAGNVTSVTDPKAQTTRYGYDALSRIESVEQHLGQTVSYGYDPRGRLDTVTNARDNVLDYGYFPWGGLENVEHFVDAGAPTPDRTVSYTYDDNGNIEATSDTDFSTTIPLYTITYDELDRADVVTAHYIPGGDRTLDSDFDRFGNRSDLTFTDGGDILNHSWLFDDFDRIHQATLAGTSPLSFSYYANDEPDVLTHGNGVNSDWDYYLHGPIQSIGVTGGAGQLHSLDYTPNAVLNVDTVDEEYATGSPTYTYDYDYDPADRLEQAQYPTALGLPALEEFDYDEAGNRELPGDPGAYDYDANNRITVSPAKAYLFDDDGNIEKINSGGPDEQRFTYDKTNRLRRYENDATGVDAQYLYDPFGRRIRKTMDGVTTWYLWDRDQPMAEFDGTGARERRYTYAGGYAPAEMAVPDGGGGEDVYQVHTDHLDSPRMLTDAAGTAIWRAAYHAFGETTPDQDPDGDLTEITFNVRFPGQYFDEESGLNYNRSRYYDPVVGRFLSADPIGQFGFLAKNGVKLSRVFPGPESGAPVAFENSTALWGALDVDLDEQGLPRLVTTHLYEYGLNSPVNLIDPDGEGGWAVVAVLVVIAFATAVVVTPANKLKDNPHLTKPPGGAPRYPGCPRGYPVLEEPRNQVQQGSGRRR